jgi:hypothetical protein
VTGSVGLWAGNWAYGNRGTYRLAQVTFKMPSITGHIGASAAFWAGVGGAGNTTPWTLVQDGEYIMNCPDGYTGAQCIGALRSGTLPTSGGTWRYNFPFYDIVNSNTSYCPNFNNCENVVMTGLATYTGDTVTAYVDSNYADSGSDYFQVCDNTSSTCTSNVPNSVTGALSDSASGECVGEEPSTIEWDNDYYDANFGTEELNDCLITDGAGTANGVGVWPHNYNWVWNTSDKTMVTVGSITNNLNFPVTYCTTQTTTGNFCG